ncbi:hypothetical protein F5Y19DRAFT_484649 [Xylariaceae sp. FL1651]|nr:hypothetical protein F5Y19DRAFT_484649 [Xylariaceae sp. FL1651]
MQSNRHDWHGTSREDFRAKSGNLAAYELINSNDPLIAVESRESASWTTELVSLTLSVLFIAAQVIILVCVREKPYYETWRLSLSLSSVLAILTTASKTAQLHAVGEAIGQVKWVDFKAAPQRLDKFEIYDRSSRGPRGAVEFIFRVRWGLATVGPFVTLLALAADPFTQQVIQLEARISNTSDSTALFGFAYEYNTKPSQTGLSNFNTPELSSRDPGLQGAILKGIFNIETPNEFRCGGACSWNETYYSLGFSSTCVNITQAAQASKVCGFAVDHAYLICNYTTPSGVHFSTQYDYTNSATALRVATNDTFFSSIPTEELDRVPANFLNVAIFQSRSGEESSFGDPDIVQANITECSLSLSLHEYSNITANGSQLIIGHHTAKSLEPGWFNGSDDSSSPLVTFNQSKSGPLATPLSINVYDWANAVLFFESEAFTSHIISGYAINPQVGNGAAFLNKDPAATFDSMVSSMTDYVRSLAKGPNVQTASGSRIEKVVFVHVRWEWLTLPLFEELAALIFVIWVIINNKHHRIPGWKSSALALLAHQFKPAKRLLVTKYSGPKEVEKEAKRIEVQIQ